MWETPRTVFLGWVSFTNSASIWRVMICEPVHIGPSTLLYQKQHHCVEGP